MLSEIWRCSPSDWVSEWVKESILQCLEQLNDVYPQVNSRTYMQIHTPTVVGGGMGGVGGCHILNHSNWAYMNMYKAACLGMSKKKQLTCWRVFCRFCPFCKYNIFTLCYICVASKIIFPHKLYPFRSFISWWIKSHTRNFSFSPLNRVDVCRERFFYSKLICKGKQLYIYNKLLQLLHHIKVK